MNVAGRADGEGLLVGAFEADAWVGLFFVLGQERGLSLRLADGSVCLRQVTHRDRGVPGGGRRGPDDAGAPGVRPGDHHLGRRDVP